MIPVLIAILVSILVAATSMLDATPLYAYVLKGPQILDLMDKELGSASTLKVLQEVRFFDAASQTFTQTIQETVLYRFPDEFRSDIESENAKRIYVSHLKSDITIIDGVIQNNPSNIFERYKDPLLLRRWKLINDRLMDLGIDTTISSLGRFRGQIAFVIGAQYPDESVSQLWVLKDQFKPIRWIIDEYNNDNTMISYEIRYSNWQQFEKTWYPMQIEYYINNQLARDIQAQKVIVNPNLDETLFDLEQLRSSFSQPLRNEPATDEEKSKELDEVHKTIENFKKRYE